MTTQEQIISRAKELGFEYEYDLYFKNLPFGLNSNIFLVEREGDKFTLGIDASYASIYIREVESLEDFELLYNAILPEKYRLPFD